MQKIIEDIYYGRLSVSEQTYPKGSQYDETLSEVVKLAEDLQTLLLSEHHDTTKEFDWESTGHQECWTPEARERKRQMMIERWAKQKCQR